MDGRLGMLAKVRTSSTWGSLLKDAGAKGVCNIIA